MMTRAEKPYVSESSLATNSIEVDERMVNFRTQIEKRNSLWKSDEGGPGVPGSHCGTGDSINEDGAVEGQPGVNERDYELT